MINKKCDLCEKQLRDFTAPGSNNKAEIFVQGFNWLTFLGDDSKDYFFECNYCPQCGRKLSGKDMFDGAVPFT